MLYGVLSSYKSDSLVEDSGKEKWEWATCMTYMDGDVTKKSVIVYAALKSKVHFLRKRK